MTILHHEMVARLAKPGIEIVQSLDAQEAHIIHMAIGVSGEVAELFTAFLNDDRDNALEELGDIEFYFEGLCQGTEVENKRTAIPQSEVKSDPLPDLIIQAGNVLDTAKKIAIYKDASKMDALRTEMERFRNKLDEFYSLAEFTHQQALDANIAKLGKRYEGFNYSNEAAQARADKAGE